MMNDAICETGNRKIAAIFPGMGYHKDKPLLYNSGKMAVPLYTYPDCNHSLESGNVLADVGTLQDVVQKTAEFLSGETKTRL